MIYYFRTIHVLQYNINVENDMPTWLIRAASSKQFTSETLLESIIINDVSNKYEWIHNLYCKTVSRLSLKMEYLICVFLLDHCLSLGLPNGQSKQTINYTCLWMPDLLFIQSVKNLNQE